MNKRKIGGKRLIWNGEIKCKECGVVFMLGKIHPEFYKTEIVNGIPINIKCQHSGKITPVSIELLQKEEFYFVEKVKRWGG